MSYEELIHNPDYKEISSVSHTDIKGLIFKEIAVNRGWSHIARIYQITGVLVFIIGCFKALLPFFKLHKTTNLIGLGWGILFTFTVLIVLHELIHAAAYRWVGATNLSFGMEWRKFLFFVQADKQVLNYNQFKIVALAPVIVVGVLSILGMVVTYHHPAFYFFLTVFAFHSLFCAGDFGLLCFFQNRFDHEILTFDSKYEKKTYFFSKQK